MSFRTLSLNFAFLIVAQLIATTAGQCRQPDPDALLKGVQSRRESLPDCSFDLEVHASGAMSGLDGATFRVNYSDGKFMYRRDEEHVAMSRDGEMIYYNPRSCTIKNPEDSGVGFLFDPRLFGLSLGYYETLDFDVALRNTNRTGIKVMGREEINDHQCWKIRLDDEWGEIKFFWIDPSSEFRVLKTEHRIGTAVGTTINCYENDFDFLPSRIVTNRDQNPQYEIEFVIKNVDRSPEPCSFDLSSLGMKIGTPVSDIRIKQRIGYWNGRKLVDFVSSSPTNSETESSISKFIFWPLVVLAVVALFAFPAYLKRPKTS